MSSPTSCDLPLKDFPLRKISRKLITTASFILNVRVRTMLISITVFSNSKVMFMLNVTPIVRLKVKRILTVTSCNTFMYL